MEIIKKKFNGVECAMSLETYKKLFDNIIMVKATVNGAEAMLAEGSRYLLGEPFETIINWVNTYNEALISLLIQNGCPLHRLFKNAVG